MISTESHPNPHLTTKLVSTMEGNCIDPFSSVFLGHIDLESNQDLEVSCPNFGDKSMHQIFGLEFAKLLAEILKASTSKAKLKMPRSLLLLLW